jgi:hypothetical protein
LVKIKQKAKWFRLKAEAKASGETTKLGCREVSRSLQDFNQYKNLKSK